MRAGDWKGGEDFLCTWSEELERVFKVDAEKLLTKTVALKQKVTRNSEMLEGNGVARMLQGACCLLLGMTWRNSGEK